MLFVLASGSVPELNDKKRTSSMPRNTDNNDNNNNLNKITHPSLQKRKSSWLRRSFSLPRWLSGTDKTTSYGC